MGSRATQFLTRTYQQPFKPAKLKSAINAKSAPIAQPDAFDEFLWALAKKFTNSREEAVAAVEEMQRDIRQCAENNVSPGTNEKRLVDQIAWRRLKRFLQ